MKCPKCEGGIIDRIKFKSNGRVAYLCDFCDTLWLEGESIDFATGHDFELFMGNYDREYTVDGLNEKNQNYDTVQYVHHR